MANNVKRAFDNVRADDNLKSKTMLYLRSEMQKRRKNAALYYAKGSLLVVASFFLVAVIYVLPYKIYSTPSAFVDVDVNPSIELALNRFNIVIGSYSYNEKGSIVLAGINLKHKKYDDAISMLICELDKYGYIDDDSLISITLQTDDESKEEELLSGLRANLSEYSTADIFAVSCDTRNIAHMENLSPAKYIAIQQLIEVNPSVTIDSHRAHSIKEIRKLTIEHASGHHNESDSINSIPAQDNSPSNAEPPETNTGQNTAPIELPPPKHENEPQSHGHHSRGRNH